MMKVARLAHPGRIELTDEPTPTPSAGEVLVEVHSVGLCGSDRHYMADDSCVHGPEVAGLVLGHEAAGVVTALGSGVSGIEVGTPVAIEPALPCGQCRFCVAGVPNVCPATRFLGYPPTDGSLREFLTLPVANVLPASTTLTFDQIAMAEALAVAVYAVDCANAANAKSAAVIGCGTIGLMLVQLMARQKLETLIAIDALEYKLPLATKFGATHALSADRTVIDQAKQIAPTGVDVVFEIAGGLDTPAMAIELAGPTGCVVMGGINPQETITYNAAFARRRGLTVINLRRSNNTTYRAIELIDTGQIDVASLVTHRFGMDQISEAFATFNEYRDNCVKVVIDPTQ